MTEKIETVKLVAETLLQREVIDGHDLAVLLGEEEPKPENKASDENPPADNISSAEPAEADAAVESPEEKSAPDGFIPARPLGEDITPETAGQKVEQDNPAKDE